MKKCCFCFPLDDRNESLLITQTKNFYVIASLGPMVEGYLLICSKKHYPSCRNLSQDLIPEFEELKQWTGDILKKVYGKCTFFEHGKIKTCCKATDNAHCFHAHLHALPIDVDAKPILVQELGEAKKISTLGEVSDIFKERPYFYYETGEEKLIWPAPIEPRPQFFRWVLAKQLGVPKKADWQVNPDWEGAGATAKKLRKHFTRYDG